MPKSITTAASGCARAGSRCFWASKRSPPDSGKRSQMLAGLMSRWTSPALCRAASPAQESSTTCLSSKSDIGWAAAYSFRSAPIKYSRTRKGMPPSTPRSMILATFGWYSPARRPRFLHERSQNSLAFAVGCVGQRFRLGDLEHEQSVRAGFAHQPDRADAAFAQGLHQLVAVNDLRFLFLGFWRRRRRTADGRAHRAFEQRRGDRAERGEPDVQERQFTHANGARHERCDALRVLACGLRQRARLLVLFARM